MKRWGAVCILATALNIGAADPARDVRAYNVVWDSPSADHHESMPLGNGDISVNSWMTPDGDLHLLIGKTDAWDDNARLVKIGKVRFHFAPNPLAGGRSFRQELKLEEGAIEIAAGDGPECRIRLWVDANHPVIQIQTRTAEPIEATASIEMWRTNQQQLAELQISDVMMNRKTSTAQDARTILEPDTLLVGQQDRIGWFHHNVKSVGPQLMAQVQGLTGFKQADPLLHRTFGAVVKAQNGSRASDLQLRLPARTSHLFSVYVLTRCPSTAERWQEEMDQTIARTERKRFGAREAAHQRWWREFWDRSWIRASANSRATPPEAVPANRFTVRIGMDQTGGNKYSGELGRVSVYSKPLSGREIVRLAGTKPPAPIQQYPSLLFVGTNLAPRMIEDSTTWDFSQGLTVEAWVKPQKLPGGGARLVDRITPGQRDGFLFDTYPGNSLRFICGETQLDQPDALPEGRWTHVAAVADRAGCRLYVQGKVVAEETSAPVSDEAAHVSQMYHLQRFITACAGRGAYPIKFNGSLFTVAPGPQENDHDYRRWGPGYWWQNTRLPYISLCASGDFDLQQPLFLMYVDELLPLCKYRTRLYLGHEGAFYPECIMFWGAVFSETYGWTPFEERQDKLQQSGWHKWEWVGGLELCWMMLDYYEHTLDREFLRDKTLPFCREILTFFEQHYPTNANGKLVMHPSQAVETWWHCTNATPELAGCIAVSERLLTLPDALTEAADRSLWRRLRAKLPTIPLRDVGGRKALAPAETFADKRNIENPELYPVFPFRLFAFNRENVDWAMAALEHRWDRGHAGWRQDDIFMAYLGLTSDSRKAVVARARAHDRNERFPAFWGPNYDWTPDQDHGGVLMKVFQAMLIQTDGRQIYLLPAWPKDWDVDFKLHAPGKTVIEGSCRNGKVSSLRVTPSSRRANVTVLE